ncbi:MAG: IgGFc-binding protein [Kofleriaceae bacterium]
MRTLAALCAIAFTIACGPGRRDEGACTPGALRCNGNELQTCVNDAFQDSMACPNACSDQLGCTLCVPGTGTCSGNDSHACADDGMSYVDETCDPVQGETCDAMTGACSGSCAPKALGNSYIGCEYYPTVTGNTTGTTFDFAVAIANTTSTPATVTIDGGALTTPQTVMVAPNAVTVQNLPWVASLKLCDTPDTDGCLMGEGTFHYAALAAKGGYHLRSTLPVTVYQFNSLEYVKGSIYSYSNDASLLLPVNVWRTRYFAAAWQQLGGTNASEMAVTAGADNTMVTVTSKAATPADQGAPALTAGTAQTVMLNAGDVLEVASITGDLTGSLIDSTAPVQLISGHYCADVPAGVQACDHLEESMFPVDTLGTHYVINAPAVTSIPAGKAEIVRVIATADGTNLTYDPPVAGAPATIATAGGFIEIPSNATSYQITSDQKVLVAQYMEGQAAGGNTGDPAMALAVPSEQFRTSYLFHAPTNYESNYVDVTAPAGASVSLDGGAPLTFTPIGTSGFGLSRVQGLTAGPGNDGNHNIQGDMAFGITVYGYGQYTSYWYPGGLNLDKIIE